MTLYAAALHDLDNAWRTPRGTALLEAALAEQVEGTVLTVRGVDVLVLRGRPAEVAALVAGLLRTTLPGAGMNRIRVFEQRDSQAWTRVTRPPIVPDLPDEPEAFEPDDDRPLAARRAPATLTQPRAQPRIYARARAPSDVRGGREGGVRS